MNIYIDASRNIVVDGNTLRVNTDTYNTKWGRACGVGMAPESGGITIANIEIKNNVMIGTRMGIYFFTMGTGGGYDKIKIFHNTLWNVSVTPIWFRAPNNTPTQCEMKNNFIYHTGEIEFSPKSSWDLGYNYFYNTWNVPGLYYDSTSKSAHTLDLNGIFNNNANCNYWDQNVPASCLHPSKNPGYFKLENAGTATSVDTDFGGCEDTTEGTTSEYEVKIKINYCTSNGQIVRLVGSHCSWSVGSCTAMTNEGSCNWSATFTTAQTFNYKFVIANGSSASRWESDPNRQFNGASLKKLADSVASGSYETCTYKKAGSVITMTCFWR